MLRVRLSGWRLASAPRHATGVPRRVKVEAQAETTKNPPTAGEFFLEDLDEVGWLLPCGESEEWTYVAVGVWAEFEA